MQKMTQEKKVTRSLYPGNGLGGDPRCRLSSAPTSRKRLFAHACKTHHSNQLLEDVCNMMNVFRPGPGGPQCCVSAQGEPAHGHDGVKGSWHPRQDDILCYSMHVFFSFQQRVTTVRPAMHPLPFFLRFPLDSSQGRPGKEKLRAFPKSLHLPHRS